MKIKNVFFSLIKRLVSSYSFSIKILTAIKIFCFQYNYNYLPMFCFLKTKKIIKRITNSWFFDFLLGLKKIKKICKSFIFVNFEKKKYIYKEFRKYFIVLVIKSLLSINLIKKYEYVNQND